MQDLQAEVAKLGERIARCRGKIQQAAGNPQQIAGFEKQIIQFYTAAGRTPGAATEQAAAVRSYIEAVPDLLQRVLQSVQEPDAPDAWWAKRLALLHVALDAFERSPAIPDHLGLGGLLDNSYLATRLLPEEFQVEVNHDRAIEILGPFTIMQLDQVISERRAALNSASPAGTNGGSNASMLSPADARGDCKDCIHMRHGAPVVQAAFDNLLDAVRASARQSYMQKLREERETSRQFVDELEALKRNGDTYYTRRPTERRIMYCGVEELDGAYQSCEVKNVDRQCARFVLAAQPPTGDCATCRHRFQIPSSVFHTLQLVAGHVSSGQKIRDKIEETLRMQAQSEFEECVEYGGFLHSSRPGTMPHCQALSSSRGTGDTRFVVGPVVNVGKRCDRWEVGDNEDLKRLLSELATLDIDAKCAWQDLTHPPVLESSWVSFSDRMRDAAVNADADVLEFGLNMLGVYTSSVETLCTSYVGDVGGTGSSRTPRASRAGVSTAAAGYRRKETPFIVEPGKIYRHPEQYNVTIECRSDSGVINVRDDGNASWPFSIADVPADSWQGLAAANGQRLRAAVMVSREAGGAPTVRAAWL